LAGEFIFNQQRTNSNFKHGMIKESQSKYMADKVDKGLNNRGRFLHLLVFENCVYDFNIPSFREGTPVDMVTMSV